MEFGCQSTFDMVQTFLADPNSAADYHLLYAIIQRDCRRLLSGWDLSPEDREDIIQEAQISVFSCLLYYAERFADAAPAQRNAYLRTVLFRRGGDLLESQKRHKNLVSYDNEDFPQELCSTRDDLFQTVSSRDTIQQVLTQVCQLDFPEDQIIAFLATRCTVLTGKNSKPSQVAQQLNGLSLQDAAAMTIHWLQEECPFPISRTVYAPLLTRLAPDSQTAATFDLTSKEISHASSKIIQQLRKQHCPIIGGFDL